MNMNMTNNSTLSVSESTMGVMEMEQGMEAMAMVMTHDDGSGVHFGAMHSYFFWGPGFYYLFKSWFVETNAQFIGACFGTIFLAGIVTIFSRHLRKVARGTKDDSVSSRDFLAAMAFGMDTFLHYVLMLIAMSFNIMIVVSIALGCGLGHLGNLFLEKKEKKGADADGRVQQTQIVDTPSIRDLGDGDGCH